jgi:hypothetical protein
VELHDLASDVRREGAVIVREVGKGIRGHKGRSS